MDFPDLVGPIYKLKERAYRKSPCHSNRASQLGGDCVRELVYWRTCWEQAATPPLDLIVIFQEGQKHEDAVLEELRKAGLQICEQQTMLEWREFQITGHIDAVIVDGVEAIPVEIKSMSPHIWDGIFRQGSGIYAWGAVAEDFQKKPWLRKYLAQVTLYCLMKNADRAVLVCINKATGALAQVNVPLDYAYGDMLIGRASDINQHVDAGTLPERIPFDEEVCPRCPFYAICLPDHVGKNPIAFLEDSTIVALLQEREAYEDSATAYDKADKRVKEWAKAREEMTIAVGDWLVRKKKQANGTRVIVERITS